MVQATRYRGFRVRQEAKAHMPSVTGMHPCCPTSEGHPYVRSLCRNAICSVSAANLQRHPPAGILEEVP
jgi:hypothetical protein